MKDEERNLDLALADAEAENRKLKARIVDLERAISSAKDMVGALNEMSDYATWARLLAKLEKDLARL
jgi:cell division protein FtsB